MAEKDSDDFEEADDDALAGNDDVDLDAVFKDLDRQRKRGGAKPAGEPAWRKLEKYLEDKRTAELLADFDDDLDALDGAGRHPPRRKPRRP